MSSEAAARQEVLAELSAPELEVLRLMADGLDSGAIAQHLGIAPHSVEGHVRRLVEKLRTDPRLRAVLGAMRPGLIEL